MDKAARFKKSILYIEEHLHGEISLELAAQAGYTSLMQLYRDCYTYTGHSVKEYIRKRRLSVALALIRAEELPLAEIAYACGYSSQQALCKYVKSATAMTPLEYQKNDACYYFPAYDSQPVRQVTVTTDTIPKTLHTAFYYPEPDGIEHRALQALSALLPGYKGRIFGRGGQPRSGEFCYKLAVEYDYELMDIFADSVFQEAAVHPEVTCTFAKTTVAHKEAEITQAWNYLYGDWLRLSMFKQDEGGYFEEYICKGSAVNKLVLYLPVVKRPDYNSIRVAYCDDRLFLTASRSGEDAEEQAAAAVISSFSMHNPGAIRKGGEFYVSQNGLNCTCGVRVESAPVLPADCGLELLQLAAGHYAVLESSCCSDGRVFGEWLDSWIRENGWNRGKGPAFTTYKINGSYDPEKIQMRVWIRLEIVKNR
ncbi:MULTISPECIES: helix-turn-helix domain-containing protein [unclassified Paenibacillus]|uniref:helix-turn-helix domain-containing protein n=1 Tax=unclassified Paenibacillus TaxID=185978 RepID=UPI00240589E7|nr:MULTISPECIES: helix-turn-helix domain-containing protein [unclassified Paenibacillus]MDF9843719.1 AraC family transcriptional regulator [Paenibacillus sp. PastF-2]MDF9851764.1 AraC family transcriptional regulator [Paenibacillus sp. PastM-2]MDF9858366.1 AraC family transcriptional regulator [Paenibacillus sp. PastF-1]MDH6483655.1 AraC family transcriptional regulator [Paenibacillus sp. PastH-2]MDH6505053.1 AraC family transcriptional regulator [Paenibacillus sp. PastM-3]